MFLNRAVYEKKVGERTYILICPSDAPLGEALDVLSEMKGYVIDMIVKANAKPEEPKEVPKEG